MDITAVLKQLKKIKNYADNLEALDQVSALDEAILKKNVEHLYELIISDYFNTETSEFKSEEEHVPSKVVEENFSFTPTTIIERDNTRVQETPKEKEPIFMFDEPSVSENAKDETTEEVENSIDQTADYSEFEELFEFEEGSELSHKLSQTPVSDIMKAMGLNEIIFTRNELFGGNNQEFDQTVETLNSFNSFDEAKSYLVVGPARKYNWNDPKHRQIAINFIKLVYRRYK